MLIVIFFGVTAGVTIKNSEQQGIKSQTEPIDSPTVILHQLDLKDKAIYGQNYLAAEDEQNVRTMGPCYCSENDLKQIFAQFIGLDPPFLVAFVDGEAQTIALLDQIAVSDACRLSDGTSMCGQPMFKFVDIETLEEITKWRYKGLTWNACTNELTLKPTNDDLTGLHKVLLTSYLPSLKDVFQTVEVAYFINSATNNSRKLQDQADEEIFQTDTGQPRRLQPVTPTPGWGYCLNLPSMLNLLNTGTYAEQSGYLSTTSQTAVTGCDGNMIQISTGNPPSSYDFDKIKLVTTSTLAGYWKVTFLQQASIKSILYLNRDDITDRCVDYTVTFGSNADVNTNPVCVAQGVITDGGWYLCSTSMTGTIFGIHSSKINLNFMEAMAYSQEAIQMNALSVSIIGTSTAGYPASNALQKFVILLNTRTGQKCVVITPPSGGLATFSIKIKAQVPINGVTLLPGYQQSLSNWPGFQTNVAIYGKTVAGTQQLCGVLPDFYTNYSEASCNFQANEIIAIQQTIGNGLYFCGFGALADCDCTYSSLDPSYFTTPPATPLASITSLSVTSTDALQSIQLCSQAPDTVSTVCGSADGVTKCGPRSLNFKDKLTGQTISGWPFRGYSWNVATWILALDPAQADATIALTAIFSLQNYPTVTYSIDIFATVLGGKTNPQTPIAPTTLAISNTSVKITWTAPGDGGSTITAYTIRIKQSDGVYSGDLENCNGSDAKILTAKSCTIPIQSLQAAPFNLAWGTSIYSTVQASNIYGNSVVSPAGNGAVIVTNPDAPIQLTATKGVTGITLNWLNGSSNGGQAVIDYQLLWAKEGMFTVLASDISKTSYTTPVVLANSSYKFKVQARNAFGSSEYSTEVSVSFTASQTVFLPTQTMRVDQSQKAILKLPDLGSQISYIITGQQKLTAEIIGNQLIVHASNVRNGIYILILNTVPEGEALKVEVEVQSAVDTSELYQLPLNQPLSSLHNTTKANEKLKSALPVSAAINGAQDLEPAIMKLKKISNRGLLEILFSKEVIPVLNLTDFMLHTEIKVKQGGQYSYNTSFSILNMTDRILNIQLNFSAPRNVSASRIPDKLYIQFNQTLYTRANQLPVVNLNHSIAIPMQLSDNKYEEMVINAVNATVKVLNVVSGSTFVSNMLANFALSKTLRDIKGLTVICTLYCANFQYPALARQLSQQMLQFLQFDLFDCDSLYNQIFGTDETEPYSPNFLAAGYGSRQLVRTMGSLFIVVFCFLIFSLCARILLFAKFLPDPLRSKILEFLSAIYWNGFFGFIRQNYIMLIMGSLLNITNINGWRSLDFHAIFSTGVLAVCIAAPITLFGLSNYHFEQLKDKKSQQSLMWGAHMNEIRIQRVFTEKTSVAEWALNSFMLSQSQAILASSMTYVYEFLFVLVLLFLDNYPWAQLLITSFMSLAQIMSFIYLAPFKDASYNRSEIASQVLVLVFVLTTRCFTDWVPDTDTRQYVAYVHVGLILGFLLVMLLTIIWKVLAKLKLVVNLMTQICKRQQLLTDLAFVFRDNKLLSNCIQIIAKKKQKEQLTFTRQQEMGRVYGNRLSIQIDSQLSFESQTGFIQVKTKPRNQPVSLIQDLKQSEQELELSHANQSGLLDRLRKLLELSQPKQLIDVPFIQIQSYYRNELATFNEVNKKNMVLMLEVLTHVQKTGWPYGMVHIREIELNILDWTAFYDLDWEWLDCVPIDFYLLERDVQNLFVRDILLLQVSQSRPEVRKLEQLIRDSQVQKMDRFEKYFQGTKFQQWHSEIDDFQAQFVGKYMERMEILNSALDTWPTERMQIFLQQLEEKRSKSDANGYIEYLQNLHMVAMEIVAGCLE